MKQFRSGEIKVLVATDVAARGLDIKAVKCGVTPADHVTRDLISLQRL